MKKRISGAGAPADSGFHMPAEWMPHSGTFIAWPRRKGLWPDGMKDAEKGYAAVINAISEFEQATVIVHPRRLERARDLCGTSVSYIVMDHDDSWIRDNGPTIVLNGQGNRAAVAWKFNAWGEKYTPFHHDAEVAGKLGRILGLPVYEAPIILEGGSIHVDGQGTLVTTEECLLNPNRNPAWSREDITAVLEHFTGASKVIWLPKGLPGDETDGHVDNIACFTRPGQIAIQTYTDGEGASNSRRCLEILRTETDAAGRTMEIVEIPAPEERKHKGVALTLSYINYALVNGGLILPVFGGSSSRSDARAAGILSEIFPDRKIRTVDGLPIIKGGGNVHCITQQFPAGIADSSRGSRS